MNPAVRPQTWFGRDLGPGESVNAHLEITESYASRNISIPLRICRGVRPGPTVFVTGALHGDELNGTGAVRSLITDDSWSLGAGTLIMVPVVNMLGFERHSRYLPDRRDLNRCFPGNAQGSMAVRMAKVIFDSLAKRSDFGIDLHTAAVRRTNYPNVRADLANPACRRIAEAFGAGVILNSKGPKGSFRREATRIGCPTIVVEGGEVWKVEPSVVECMTRGVQNVMIELGMTQGLATTSAGQAEIRRTKWIRAERGGFMDMHVAPGAIVTRDQPLATNSTLVHEEQNQLFSPFDGIVIGMTTLPAVQPGEPVIHLGQLDGPKAGKRIEAEAQQDQVQRTAAEHLSTSFQVTEPEEMDSGT